MTIFGWDASDFDWGRGPMDLGAAARDGITFFTHKATEGTRTRHVHYGEALNRARSAGIQFLGAYVVPRTPGNNGHGTVSAQVDYLLSYLDAQTPWWRSTREFFLQVDTEKWGYDNVSPAVGAQMCDLLRARTGKWVVHYAPGWAYGNSIPGDHPLWQSAYGSNPAVHYRQAYRGDADPGWRTYSSRTPTVLQYGSKVTIGSQPGCDINAFRGTVEQLRALITGGDMTPQESQRLSDVWDILTSITTADGKKVSAHVALSMLMELASQASKPAPIALDAAAEARIAEQVTAALIEAGGLTGDEVRQIVREELAALTLHADTGR